jgi:predicted  nucleic acid-binding Zn-ribbon protein
LTRSRGERSGSAAMANQQERELARLRDAICSLERRNQELEGEIAVYRQAAEKLRTWNEHFNEVIDSLPHPFYVIDAETHRVVLANRRVSMK